MQHIKKIREGFEQRVHEIDEKNLRKASGIVFGLVALSFLLARWVGEEQIRAWVEQAGIWGPVLLIIWKALTVIVAPLSGSLVYIAAGALYGVKQGLLYGVIGNMIGMSGSYWIGRFWGEKGVKYVLGDKLTKEVVHLISHLKNTKVFISTRVVFFMMEDLLNYACGMAKINFRLFLAVGTCVTTTVSWLLISFGTILL